MKTPLAFAAFQFVALCLSVSLSLAQESPLTRTFRPGERESYRVVMKVFVEVHKVSLNSADGKTYVRPVTKSARAQLSWTVTKAVESVVSDGTAEISESSADFAADCGDMAANVQNDPELQKALGEFCAHAYKPHRFMFHEQSTGLISDLPAQETINLGESSPPLLTLWLRHAAQPAALLPDQPFVLGAVSRRTVSMAVGSLLPDAKGSQSTEWLPSAGDSSTARLHVVQDMTWTAQADHGAHGSDSTNKEAKESFFADSLSTISLLDGSVLAASRSASRETRWTLAPVPGLDHPPEFRVKLTVAVKIRKLS